MGSFLDNAAAAKFSRAHDRELSAAEGVSGHMFSAAKDAMASRAAQAYVNGKISRYGQLQDFRIDSSNHRMEATCVLHGEPNPINVTVERYSIHESAGRKFIEIHSCRSPRPWLQALLDDFVKGRRIELPAWAASAL